MKPEECRCAGKRERCGGFRQKLSMKIYDCRGLSRCLCRLEQSMKEVCRILDAVGNDKCKEKRQSCRRK